MDLKIDEATIRATTLCRNNTKCLKDEVFHCGIVESSISNKLIFVKCVSRNHCNYRMPFGKSIICRCPVRNETYFKHGR